MGIKGILFDKDGTLLDFHLLWSRSAPVVVDQLIHMNQWDETEVDRDFILKAMGVEAERVIPEGALAYMTYSEIGGEISRALSQKKIHKDSVLLGSQLSVLYETVISDKDYSKSVITDLPNLFHQLKGMGLKIGLATADTFHSAQKCFKALNVYESFDFIGSDDGILRPKPKADMFDSFAKKFGFLPEEIAVVGDTPNDMIFAHKCGGTGIGVLSGLSSLKDLEDKADYVISSVKTLPELIDNLI